MIVDEPKYVPNLIIQMDLQTPTVKEEIRHYSYQYSACLIVHPKDLVVNLMAQQTTGDCKDTFQTICLADSKLNCLICSLIYKV
jgi:hypothetical protein